MRKSTRGAITAVFVAALGCGALAGTGPVAAAQSPTAQPPTAQSQAAQPVFAEDFEGGNLDQWDNQSCPDGVQIVDTVHRSGTHAAKFTVADDDKHSKCGDVPTETPRAQLVSQKGLFHDGDDFYVGFSVMFPQGFPKPENFFQVSEFYGSPFGGPPTMGVYVCGDRVCFQRKGKTIWTSDHTIAPDKWNDLVFHVRFATDDSGFVEVWDNGKAQTMSNGKTRTNYTTLEDGVNWDGSANTLNLNQYRSSDDKFGSVTIYEDDAKVGTTYASAAP